MKSYISDLSLNKRISHIIVSAVIVFILCACLLLICDYSRVETVRKQASNACLGATESEVIGLIGHPDSVSKGTFAGINEKPTKAYTVWTYCSRFDWVGFRNRSDDSSAFYYWYSRLNPQKNTAYDSIVELWFMNGKVSHVIENNSSSGFGQHSVFSF